MSAGLERTQPAGDLAVAGDDDRALARLMARARIFSKVPGLKKELAGNPEAVAGIMLTLDGYGLPPTLPAINNSFDWIEGSPAPTAQLYQILARRAGWHLRAVEETAERCVVEITDGHETHQITFGVEHAKAAGRLDEWVEQWRDGGNGKRFPVRFTVRVNAEKVNEPWPEWVRKEIDAGRVKRFDAWWLYRADMLWKSAAKRAVKRACPEVLLGDLGFEDDQVLLPASAPDGAWERAPEGAEEPVDAELVEDPPLAAETKTGEILEEEEGAADDGRPFD